MSKRRIDYSFLHEVRPDYIDKIKNGEIKSRDKIPFICNIHGEYWQRILDHEHNKCGCPECGKIKASKNHIRTDYDFLDEIEENDRKLVIEGKIRANDKVTFICEIHGNYKRTLNNHRKGKGCPICGRIKASITHIRKNYNFIDEIRKDYQFLIKEGLIKRADRTKIPFICKVHGEYLQTLNDHIGGCGCPKCGKEKMDNFAKSRIKRDYSYIHEIREDYQIKILNGEITCDEKVPFICQKHGEYWQNISNHKNNSCPKCDVENRTRKNYDYINEIRPDFQIKITNGEINSKTKVPFICQNNSDHGEYWQTLSDHDRDHGCPKCNKLVSKLEIEIYKYIRSLLPNTEVQNNVRGLIDKNRKELDIYIPSLNIGIEFDGLIWHSNKYKKDKYNLLNKTKLFNNIGIRVIHIFEDEWLYNQKFIKSKLKYIFNINKPKLFKKFTFKNMDINEFTIYGDNLLLIGSLIVGKSNILELYENIGNLDSLLKSIKNNFNIKKLVSHLDLRWEDLNNNILINNNWKKERILKPKCFYVINSRQIRFLEKMKKSFEIYDCGYIKYSKIL